MEDYNIPYKVNPPFPHKIPEMKPVLKNEWTEEEIRKLIEDNPGLKITADELQQITGLIGRTNQESRDAVLLAWCYANLPIRLKCV